MIKVISEENEWRNVLNGISHDWYHTWDYHQIAQKNEEGTPVLFHLTIDNESIAFPLLLRDIDTQWRDATSVYGYPGFLLSENVSSGILTTFIEELILWCKNNNIVSVFSRLNTCVEGEQSIVDSYSELAGETVLIDLTLPLDEQRRRYRKNYRNLVNKLIKDDVTCEETNEPEDRIEFVNIYNETMKSLQATDYYFFDQNYYDDLFQSKDFEVKIYSCFQNGQKLCSGLFVFCDDIVQYHLSGTYSDYKNMAPTRLMLDTVRRDATEIGFKKFHLGGGTSGTRDSLFDFKYGFSKQAINFRVLKLITNPEQYSKLSNITVEETINKNDGFFPLYRKKN